LVTYRYDDDARRPGIPVGERVVDTHWRERME
jgi:hypothetical protein